MAERAYHYTDIAHLPYILDAGHIRRSRHIMAKVRADVPSGIVWFSTHHRADPSTASFNNGGATPRVRLCVPQGITLDWREACRKAGWSEPDIELTAHRGRRCGARVDAWRGVPAPVPIAGIEDVHVLRPGGVWRPMPEPIFRVAGDIAVLAFEGVIYGIRRHVIPGVGTTAYTVREESERAPGDAAMLRRWLQEVAA